MKKPEDDEARLREGFAKLRASDARKTPSFAAIRRAPGRSARAPVVWLVVAPLVAAAAILVAVCGIPSSPSPVASSAPAPAPPDPADLARVSRTTLAPAPLDFLLEMQGTAFLTAVPDFDSDPVTKGRSR